MRRSPARIAGLFGVLLLAGALFGALAGIISGLISTSIFILIFPVPPGAGQALQVWSFVGEMAGIIGALLGMLLLPTTSFLLLRRVPMGVSWTGVTLGAMAGAVAGAVGAAALDLNLMAWGIGTAVAGFFAAVGVLRRRYSTPAENRVRVPAGG